MLLRPNEWKSLRSRYEEDRPHRMLALDGGGIRGLITLGILSQIEELIHQKTGQKLCEYFDYIARDQYGSDHRRRPVAGEDHGGAGRFL